MTDLRHPGAVVFSTFEPSGDALAAGVIARLRAQEPNRPIYALGGPRMAAAGAELIEATTEHAAMGLDTLRQVQTHRRRVARLGQWLQAQAVQALVPVDSPAGNWAICAQVRQHCPAARIVHLVAPQLWAWGSWRIRRMRRLSDHVLCLLPFEPDWFSSRGVGATFVGHPVFDPSCHARVPAGADLPQEGHRLALLPGSRVGEINRNWITMLDTFMHLRRTRPHLTAVIAAFNDKLATLIRQQTAAHLGKPELPGGLHLAVGRTESVLDWAHSVLVASGTATLQVGAHEKPMVALYNVPRAMYLALNWLVAAKTYTLPNLVAQWQGRERALVELIPHFGQVPPVVAALAELIDQPAAAAAQVARLREVNAAFADKLFSEAATAALTREARLG